MSIEVVLSAHDTPPPSIRSGVPEPKGREMGTRAEVIAALEAVFGPLCVGSNNTGGIGGEDPDGVSVLVNIGEGDPRWLSILWRGFHEMDDCLSRLRAAHPDWYIYHPILGEWDHHLGRSP